MSGHTDDQSIRLEEAFREVTSRRTAAPVPPASEPMSEPEPDLEPAPAPPAPVVEAAPEPQRAPEVPRDDIHALVREEVASALAESDLAVEIGVLTAAVEHLMRRVDALVLQQELHDGADAGEPAAATGSGRTTLMQGLVAKSTSRAGRSR